jgi:hypothetical protein
MESTKNLESIYGVKTLKEFVKDTALHQKLMTELVMQECAADPNLRNEMINIMTNGENFYSLLCMFIDRYEMNEVEFYKQAGISKAVFSNMKKSDYVAKKETVLKSIIGLRLNYTNASALLEKAGFAFVWKDPTDLVIIYCVMNHIYVHIKIDELLVSISEKALFSVA